MHLPSLPQPHPHRSSASCQKPHSVTRPIPPHRPTPLTVIILTPRTEDGSKEEGEGEEERAERIHDCS